METALSRLAFAGAGADDEPDGPALACVGGAERMSCGVIWVDRVLTVRLMRA